MDADEAAKLLPPETDNPHTYIEWMTTITLEQRFLYYDHVLGLVKTRPLAEQHALLMKLKAIGFPVHLTRRKMRELDQADLTKIRMLPTVDGKDAAGRRYLAEMVYRKDEVPAFGFLVQWLDDLNSSPEFFEKLQQADGTEVLPVVTSLVESGTVLLPSSYEEYGSDHDLFLAVRTFISDFVHLTDSDKAFRLMCTCYVLLSWMYDRFYALPYLRAHGDYGTGKSRLIQVVGSICYRPILAGGATTASPIFRIIKQLKGTLIIDEADFSKSDLWEEIVKILNAGYQRGQGHVLRSERASDGEPFDVNAYDCYSPKILSTRKRFSDAALESRCVSHTMRITKRLPETMPFVLDEEFYTKAQRLRNQLLLWRFRNYNKVKVDSRARLRDAQGHALEVEPRAVQIMQPVLACVSSEHVKNEILGEAIKYAKAMGESRQESLEGITARLTVIYWEQLKRPPRMALKAVAEYIQTRADIKDADSRRVGRWLRLLDEKLVKHPGGEATVNMTEAIATRLEEDYQFDRVPPGATPKEGPSPSGTPSQ
jgi:hypothetical protein